MAKKATRIMVSELTDEDFFAALDKIDAETGLSPVNIARAGMVADCISTQSLVIDLIIGGGLAPSKISGAVGLEGSGKSTVFFHTIKQAIKLGIPVLFYDYEGADTLYLRRIGLDLDSPLLRIYHPSTGDEGYRHMRRMLKLMPLKKAGRVSVLIGIDSIPGMLSEVYDADDEAGSLALQARMHAQKLPMIRSEINRKRASVWMINQLRTKPGPSFGNPEYEPGGIAVKQFADMRMKMRQIALSTANKRTIRTIVGKGTSHEEPCADGNGIDKYTYSSFVTIKNKAFSPFREAMIRFWYEERGEPGRGIDPVFDVFQYLELTGQIYRPSKKSSWYHFTDDFPDERWAGKKFQWQSFKLDVLDNLDKDGLYSVCRKQLDSEEGFRLYFKKRGGVKDIADIKEEDPFTAESGEVDNVVQGSFDLSDE